MRAPKIVTDLFTGPDGETWSIGRISAALVLLSGLSLPFWQVYRGQTVSLSEFGALLAAIAGSMTALVALTHKTEPPGPDGMNTIVAVVPEGEAKP